MKSIVMAAGLAILPLSASASPIADLRHDIACANHRFVQAFQMRKFDAMAADYESNGRYIADGIEIVGRAHLERFFANRAIGLQMADASCQTLHIEAYGPTATETGSCAYTFRKAGRTIKLQGHYVTVWAHHSQEKRWFIRFNIIPD